jgi:hypothetical protein
MRLTDPPESARPRLKAGIDRLLFVTERALAPAHVMQA